MQNFTYENEFDLHENGRAGETNFHKNSFALTLVLTYRQTRPGNELFLFNLFR